MASILVVDDDPGIRPFFSRLLESKGHEVVTAGDGVEGLRAFRKHAPDLVITDIYMPNKEGLEMIRELRRESPDVRIIAVTGANAFMGPDHVLGMAQAFGAVSVLIKPVTGDTLLEVVAKILVR
jgi:CheY-like chemotaxis protein